MRLTWRFSPSRRVISIHAVGTFFPEAYRHGAFGQLRIVHQQTYFSRLGLLAVQYHSFPQLFQGLFVRDAFDLRKIYFRQLVLRVHNVVRQPTVRRQKQEPFAIQIETTGCIDPRQIDKVRQSRPPVRIGKTRQHAIQGLLNAIVRGVFSCADLMA